MASIGITVFIKDFVKVSSVGEPPFYKRLIPYPTFLKLLNKVLGRGVRNTFYKKCFSQYFSKDLFKKLIL